jgi:hypothetical protein
MRYTTKTATDAHLRKRASEIALENVDDSTLARLLRHRRREVIECLEELLQKGGSTSERNAAASAIGTLTELEKKLGPDVTDNAFKVRG